MVAKGDMVYAWTNDSCIADKAECGGAVTGLWKFALENKIVDAVFAVKKGVDANEALKNATGHYGQWDNAAKYIDPRQE